MNGTLLVFVIHYDSGLAGPKVYRWRTVACFFFVLLPGYQSNREKPLSVYKCRKQWHCPGEVPLVEMGQWGGGERGEYGGLLDSPSFTLHISLEKLPSQKERIVFQASFFTGELLNLNILASMPGRSGKFDNWQTDILFLLESLRTSHQGFNPKTLANGDLIRVISMEDWFSTFSSSVGVEDFAKFWWGWTLESRRISEDGKTITKHPRYLCKAYVREFHPLPK